MNTRLNSKETLREIMTMAWAFVKRNGYSLSEALSTAWRNIKLRIAMKNRIVKFYFQKVDGTIREAFGTLSERLIPAQLRDNKQNRNNEHIRQPAVPLHRWRVLQPQRGESGRTADAAHSPRELRQESRVCGR